MGNYAPRMYKQQRLRDPLEDEDTARQRDKNVFGNPYRTDKKVSIDEEDEAAQMDAAVPASNASTSSSSNGSTSTAKRKRRLPPRSTTSTTVSFNRARVPTISKMKLPFLDIPPLLAWRDVKAASPRLKETRIARENLIAAYRSSAAEEAANAAAVQAMEQSPLPQPPPSSTQPPIIAAGMTPPQPAVPQQDQQPQPRPVVPTIATTNPDTPRPLPQKQSPPLQQQLQQLQAQQTLSPISPDSPTTPPTPPAAAHASLRAQIRELIWRVPKHYNSQAIITLLHHLDADARTAILPYAIQCAEKCRRFGLVDKIRAVVGKQSAPSSSSHRVSPSR
ncbi:hypothetical protein PhCBS80983_g02020 [Powellomyces hirtus]|uniref:Uncharacterized protein n=1 Tax=Powellomyces hirtus TaxID=109895 RepID=A0A507EAE4_9FUNG|nr:hypothetical protein PhCBS80983_g02020 [Powellomyces hirtus]